MNTDIRRRFGVVLSLTVFATGPGSSLAQAAIATRTSRTLRQKRAPSASPQCLPLVLPSQTLAITPLTTRESLTLTHDPITEKWLDASTESPDSIQDHIVSQPEQTRAGIPHPQRKTESAKPRSNPDKPLESAQELTHSLAESQTPEGTSAGGAKPILDEFFTGAGMKAQAATVSGIAGHITPQPRGLSRAGIIEPSKHDPSEAPTAAPLTMDGPASFNRPRLTQRWEDGSLGDGVALRELAIAGQRPVLRLRRLERGSWRIDKDSSGDGEILLEAIERLERASVAPNIRNVIIVDGRPPSGHAKDLAGAAFFSNDGSLFVHREFVKAMAAHAAQQTLLLKRLAKAEDSNSALKLTLRDKWVQLLLYYHANKGLPGSMRLDEPSLQLARLHPDGARSWNDSIRIFTQLLIQRQALGTTHLAEREDFVQRLILGGEISHDGRLVATGSSDGQIRIWETETGKQVFINARNDPAPAFATALRFSKDGTRLAVTTPNDLIEVIYTPGNDDSWKGPLTLPGHRIGKTKERSPVNTFRFSPDNTLLVSGADDGTAIIWNLDIRHKNHLHTLDHEGKAVMGADISPDGRILVTVDRRARVRVWDLHSGKLLQRIHYAPSAREHRVLKDTPRYLEDADFAVQFSPSGDRFAVSGLQGHVVRVWDTSTRRLIQTFEDPARTDSIIRIGFSDDGRLLATADTQGTVHIWDTQSRRLVQYHVFPESTLALRFDPGTHRLTVFEREGVLTRLQAYPENEFFARTLPLRLRLELIALALGPVIIGLVLAATSILTLSPLSPLLGFAPPAIAAVFLTLRSHDGPGD